MFAQNHSTAMQNHFHNYITPANESVYRNVPDHLLDFPARNERAAARERERLEQERKAREAQEQFQKQQEANAKALQANWGSPQVYAPQYTPPSYGTPQPVTRPQPQRQQPKQAVRPPARPSSPSYSGSSYSGASEKTSAWKRFGLFVLFLIPTAIASASTPLHKNALALILAACALYQLVRFGGRVASLIANDSDDDGGSAGHRCGWIFLSAAVIAGMLYFGNVEANKTLANCVFYTGVFAVYQVARLFFRVLKLMNEEL